MDFFFDDELSLGLSGPRKAPKPTHKRTREEHTDIVSFQSYVTRNHLIRSGINALPSPIHFRVFNTFNAVYKN